MLKKFLAVLAVLVTLNVLYSLFSGELSLSDPCRSPATISAVEQAYGSKGWVISQESIMQLSRDAEIARCAAAVGPPQLLDALTLPVLYKVELSTKRAKIITRDDPEIIEYMRLLRAQ